MYSQSVRDLEERFLKPYLRISLEEINLEECRINQVIEFCTTHLPLDFKNIQSNADLVKMSKLSQTKTELTLLILSSCCGDPTSLNTAYKILNFADSTNRTILLLELHKHMNEWDWISCFMRIWINCDGCSLYAEEFRAIFKNLNLAEIREKLYTPEQKQKYENQENLIQVYRGQWEYSPAEGLSWSTSQEVAQKFAQNGYEILNNKFAQYRFSSCMISSEWEKLNQIIQMNERSILIAASIPKNETLMFDRNGEKEVFAPYFSPTKHATAIDYIN